MNDMKLSYFTNDESFPLFVQFGAHDVPLFVHGHEVQEKITGHFFFYFWQVSFLEVLLHRLLQEFLLCPG